MTPEGEVVAFLARLFPSLNGLPPAEQAARADTLGLFLASQWSVGAAGLKQRGIDVPDKVHAGVAAVAARATQARRGGATFLAHVRQALADDAKFQALIIALGALFARAGARPAGATPSGGVPAVTPAQVAAARTPGTTPIPTAPAPPPRPAPALRTTGSRPAFNVESLEGAAPAAAPPPPPVVAPPPPPPVVAPPPPPGAVAPPSLPDDGLDDDGLDDLGDLDAGDSSIEPAPSPPARTASGRYARSEDPLAELDEGLDADDAPPEPAPRATKTPPPSRRMKSFMDDDPLAELDEGLDAGEEPAPAPKTVRAPTPAPRARSSALSDDPLAELDAGFDDAPASASSEAPTSGGDLDAGALADLGSDDEPAPAEAPSLDADPLAELDGGLDAGASPQAEPAPPPAPAPQPVGTDSSDFLAALVGSGLAPSPLGGAPAAHAPPPVSAPRPVAPPPPPPVAPPPAPPSPPRPATAAPPQGKASWEDFEKALESGGPLFRDEDEPAAPPPPPPRAAPKPAAPPKAAPAPASSGGELDLLPDEPPAAPEPEPDLNEINSRFLEEAPAAPPPEKKKIDRKTGSMKTASNIRVAEFGVDDTNDGEAAGGPPPDEDSAPEELPKDPAQAAITRYELTGDATALAEARRLFAETIASAPHGTARAFAEAGLAKVMLLAGNGAAAEQQAKAALDKDPGNPFAVEVLSKAARGEADRAKLLAGLAQARAAIAEGRGADAHRVAEKLVQFFPDAPQPWLIQALLAKAEQDDAAFERAVLEAWRRYPGKRFQDVHLGAKLDVDLASLMANHGRQKFKALDPEFLRGTIENVDSRENATAGLFRLAIACARVGLARGRYSQKHQRKAWTTIGSALVGLQYYDAAVEAIDKAGHMRPDENESKGLDVERRFAGQMRRAFDKPGVKAQLGKYKCVGIQALSAASQERMAHAAKERAAREAELLKAAGEIAELCVKDSRIRDEVRAAASALSVPDPIAPVEAALAELQAVKDERARLGDAASKPQAAPEKKGLFSKLAGAASAAADKVKEAAKDAQLKIKEAQLSSRRDEAVRKLGAALARDLREHAWRSDVLKTFSRRAATVEAFSDYFAEEERQAKAELDALAKAAAS